MGNMFKHVWILLCKTVWLKVIDHQTNKYVRLYNKCETQSCVVGETIARFREWAKEHPTPKGE